MEMSCRPLFIQPPPSGHPLSAVLVPVCLSIALSARRLCSVSELVTICPDSAFHVTHPPSQ